MELIELLTQGKYKECLWARETTKEQIKKKLHSCGAVLIHGTKGELTKIKKKLKTEEEVREFALIAGTEEAVRIAIPLGAKSVQKRGLQELKHFRGRERKKRILINLALLGSLLGIDIWAFKKRFLIITIPEMSIWNATAGKKNVTSAFYRTSRKFVLPLIGEDGNILGYAKAYLPENRESGENEAKILNLIREKDLEEFSVPKVLRETSWGRYIIITLGTINNIQISRTREEYHLHWLEVLIEKTGRELIFEESPYSKRLDRDIQAIQSKRKEIKNLIYFKERAVEKLKDKRMIFSLSMREFPYFQILQKKEKKLVIDWELAHFDAPIIFDLYSLFLSSPPHTKGEYKELYKKNLLSIFFSPQKANREDMDRIVKKMHIDFEDAYWLFWLFLVDQLFTHLLTGAKESEDRILEFLSFARKNEKELQRTWTGNK